MFMHDHNVENVCCTDTFPRQTTENLKQHFPLGGKASHVLHTCPHVRPYCWNIAS